ncbi:MAG: DUF533 domain-containing protein [Pseudomonadota bacterium]
MNAQDLLDQLLAAGKELVEQGSDLAAERLDLPPEGPERDEKLRTLGQGAAAAGVLALLLGTGAGRRVTGAALKLGGLAALGGLGYRAYQNWLANSGGSTQEDAFSGHMDADSAATHSDNLLRAMVAAAKADGHMDDEERARIADNLDSLQLGDDLAELLRGEVSQPLDVTDIASRASTPEQATELWLVSRMVCSDSNDAERVYLRALALELGLADDTIAALEEQLAALAG